jgi:hypothetical protein
MDRHAVTIAFIPRMASFMSLDIVTQRLKKLFHDETSYFALYRSVVG